MAKAFGYLIVGLRFPIILAWAAAVVAAVLLLPPLPTSGGLADLIPAGSPAAQADATAARLFGYPLEAGVAIVQRDPRGLPSSAVNKAARAAQAYDRHASIPGLLAVVPIPNGAGLPGRDHRLARQRGRPARPGQRAHLDDRHVPRVQPRLDHAAAGNGRRDVRAPLPDRCRRRDRAGRRPVRAGADHQPRPRLGGAVHRARDRGDRRGQAPVAARPAGRAAVRGDRLRDRDPGGDVGRRSGPASRCRRRRTRSWWCCCSASPPTTACSSFPACATGWPRARTACRPCATRPPSRPRSCSRPG